MITVIGIAITVVLTIYVHRIGKKQDTIVQQNLEMLNMKMDFKKEIERHEDAIKTMTYRLENRNDLVSRMMERMKDEAVKMEFEKIADEIAREFFEKRDKEMKER